MILALLLGSLSSHAIERPPWAGFFTKKFDGATDIARFPYIKGYADRVSWRHLEPTPGVYDWSKMDARIRDAATGKYYYYFVLWTGPHAPEWIYEHGVPRVATGGHRRGERFFPFYLDKNYINYFHRLNMLDLCQFPFQKLRRFVLFQSCRDNQGL